MTVGAAPPVVKVSMKFDFQPPANRFLIVTHDLETGKATVLAPSSGTVRSIRSRPPAARGSQGF